MKELKKLIPTILLITQFITLCFFKEPQYADSIIFLCLSVLCGYAYYVEKMEVPDIRKEVKDALKQRDDYLKTEISQLKGDIGKMSMSINRSSVNEKFNF